MNVVDGGGGYFLDTSALVKLYHQEPGTEVVEAWAADEGVELWISDLSRAEFHSVFMRKVCEAELSVAAVEAVFESFRADLEQRFRVVPLSGDTVEQAVVLLREHGTRHALRTLDALQIAAAQAATSNPAFVTADRKLRNVAVHIFQSVIDPETFGEPAVGDGVAGPSRPT
jgi:uncharacterized protein